MFILCVLPFAIVLSGLLSEGLRDRLLLDTDSESTPDDLNHSPYPIRSIDGLGAVHTEGGLNTPHRTYNLFEQPASKTWSCAIFDLPDPEDRPFLYIQYWFSHQNRTSELGLRYRKKESRAETYYRPLLFSTNDHYRTGFLANKEITWAPSQARGRNRTRDLDIHAYKNKYYPGTRVRLVVFKCQGDWMLWINGEMIGSIYSPFQHDHSHFGSETRGDYEAASLENLYLDYD